MNKIYIYTLISSYRFTYVYNGCEEVHANKYLYIEKRELKWKTNNQHKDMYIWNRLEISRKSKVQGFLSMKQ